MKFNKPLISTIVVVSTIVLGACSGSSSKKKTTVANVNCPDVAFVQDTSEGVCTLIGVITEDFTLTADKEWLLSGYVIAGTGNSNITSAAGVAAVKANGITLTIEPGTHIRGLSDGSLVISRGSKIMAEGTAAAPITFSSAQDDDFDGEGEWGGVVVQGFASQYSNDGICGNQSTTWCNVEGEGGVGVYGGNDDDDNSGIIRYVRIAEGGLVIGQGNEINGLTLQGVGHGTTVEYVQVHNNLDDGVEWFGGTVNAKYLVLTNNDDDDLDLEEGVRTNIQHVIIRKNPTKAIPSGSNDPRGIEAGSGDSGSVKETDAVIANITIVGSPMVQAGSGSNLSLQPSMRIRGDTKLELYNSATMNYHRCLEFDLGQEGDTATGTTVYFENVLGDCDLADDIDENTGLFDFDNYDLSLTLALDDAWALTNSDATPVSPTIPAVNNGSGFAFDQTTYIGAVEPGTAAASAWWAGWIIEGSLD